MITWKNEIRNISDLRPAPYNPRKFTEKQLADLTQSIERFSLADPIIINTNNTVIGGHLRLRALKAKHISTVEVRIPDTQLTEPEEKELNIRLNKNLGEFDFGLLVNFDETLLKDIGFDSAELDKIFQQEIEEDDVPPTPAIAESKTGEIYQLGQHRLMCGDSTNHEDVERLMDGKKADMVFTDPPYGVDYGAKNRFLNSFQPSGRNLKDIANDTLGKDEIFDMLVKAFTLSREFGQDHCSYYVTAPQGGELGLMMMMMIASNLPTRHVLIWNKNNQNFSLGRLDYDYKHEPILFTWKETHKFYGGGDHRNSVWDIPKERKSEAHPTMKPVSLVTNALLNSSQRGEICLDLFGGSGSTLIACEQTNRVCYMMEIDPLYCDVIRKRYEIFTRKNTGNLQAA